MASSTREGSGVAEGQAAPVAAAGVYRLCATAAVVGPTWRQASRTRS
jgi:hypothetical protein